MAICPICKGKIELDARYDAELVLECRACSWFWEIDGTYFHAPLNRIKEALGIWVKELPQAFLEGCKERAKK